MKIISFPELRLSFAVAIVCCLIGLANSNQSVSGQGRQNQPNLSPEEQNLVKGIMSAADPAAKLKAAATLIDKYPKTTIRPRVARALVDQIAGVSDANQKISLAQEYQRIFKEPSEQELILPLLIVALDGANRADEAFSTGAEFLGRNPDSLRVLIGLMSIGTDQAKKRNGKFIPQSLKYGAQAIELMETDKKPADFDDEHWKQYKSAVLPAVYQSMGILNLAKGDRAEARTRFTKAAQLAPADPFNFLMLAGLLNEEYQNQAKHYQSMPDGQAKADELKKAQTMLDNVIEAYAHAVALAESNPNLQQVRQQYLQDLEAYYKYRHHNSTEGMQQLIDKYKTPAKP